ncbi:MAG: hypothetical protein RI894_783 [Bacteroidota bacterium]|jgi:hypothetical protein
MLSETPFLTAEWRRLILLTYAVDAALLEEHLPQGLTLDTLHGRTYVSLVAFDFEKTKLRGVPVPFHTDFPEINLRFYVRQGSKRGVVFIKELVPKFWIAELANRIYNEPYAVADMYSTYDLNDLNELEVFHEIIDTNGVKHTLRFFAEPTPVLPPPDSSETFFKEQEWGFGVNHQGELTTYRVKHPEWRIHPLTRGFQFLWDFGSLYGEKWAFLNNQIPYNILLAEGSEVSVSPNEKA